MPLQGGRRLGTPHTHEHPKAGYAHSHPIIFDSRRAVRVSQIRLTLANSSAPQGLIAELSLKPASPCSTCSRRDGWCVTPAPNATPAPTLAASPSPTPSKGCDLVLGAAVWPRQALPPADQALGPPPARVGRVCAGWDRDGSSRCRSRARDEDYSIFDLSLVDVRPPRRVARGSLHGQGAAASAPDPRPGVPSRGAWRRAPTPAPVWATQAASSVRVGVSMGRLGHLCA